MRKIESRKTTVALAAAALCMTAALTLNGTSAYFTTYVSAGGSHVVNLGSQTEIHEEIVDMVKRVSITNTSENDCFVRVKVFYGGDLKVSYQDKSGGKNLWTFNKEDGYCYYGPILPAGKSTEVLDVIIGELPKDFDKESFNVIVVQECTPVVYDEDGNATADWNTVYTDYQKAAGAGEEADGQ